MDFRNKYRKVFDKNGNVKVCGREACKELIKTCLEKYPDIDFGNIETGIMNMQNIKEICDVEKDCKDRKNEAISKEEIVNLLEETLNACYRADDNSSGWKSIISIYEEAIKDVKDNKCFSVKDAPRIYLEFNSDYDSDIFMLMDKTYTEADKYLENKKQKESFILNEGYYEAIIEGVLNRIEERNFNDQTANYAVKITKLFNKDNFKIIDFVVSQIQDFYIERYAEAEIKERLKNPIIEIIDDNFGVFIWLNHNMDEHIIECEFGNDLELFYVTVDG